MKEACSRFVPLLYTQHLRLSDTKSPRSMLFMTLALYMLHFFQAASVIAEAEKRKVTSRARLG